MNSPRDRTNAVSGFADGARYQSARPGYPPAAVAYMVEALGVVGARRVLDVAAGTGLFTRELLAFTGELVAVEPSAGMRLEFERQELGVAVLEGTAESLPFDDHSIDVITVAQAFHRFDYAAALAEFARVLSPSGHLGLIWNERDESVEWVAQLTKVMLWDVKRPFDATTDYAAVLAASGFGEIERRDFRHTQRVDRATLDRRVLSTSYIAVMAPEEQQMILDGVSEIVRDFDEYFEIPYLTTTYCATTPDDATRRHSIQ
ncbi:MAG: class I SAM-dependent methyltransferase [Acidimicrobiales bacterium]